MSESNSTFSLKWENHHRNILTSVAALSKSDHYSDVTLCCEGDLFPVHRFILSSCSDYFNCLFEQLPGKPNLVVVLKDIKLTELQPLLAYIYLGEVNITQDRLPALIKAAEFLKIKGLAVSEDFDLGENYTEEGSEEHSSYKGKAENEERGKNKRSSDKSDHESSEKRKRVSNESLRTYQSGQESSEKKNCNGTTDNCSTTSKDFSDSNIVVKSEPEDYLSFKQEFGSSVSPPMSTYNQTSFNDNKLFSSSSPQNESNNFMSSCKYRSGNSVGTTTEITEQKSNRNDSIGCSSNGNFPLITQLLEEPPSIEQFFPDITKENGNDIGNAWMNPVNENHQEYESCHFMSTNSTPMSPQQRPINSSLGHGKKGFVCPYDNCQVSYKERRALQDHINLHTGIKPYFCTFCNFSTTHRTTLIQHKKYKHADTVKMY